MQFHNLPNGINRNPTNVTVRTHLRSSVRPSVRPQSRYRVRHCRRAEVLAAARRSVRRSVGRSVGRSAAEHRLDGREAYAYGSVYGENSYIGSYSAELRRCRRSVRVVSAQISRLIAVEERLDDGVRWVPRYRATGSNLDYITRRIHAFHPSDRRLRATPV